MVYWLTCILASAIGVFLWIFVHECSHALFALLMGYKIDYFKPYPNKTEGYWVWGSVGYRFTEKRHPKERWILAAPLFFSIPLVTLSMFLLVKFEAAYVFPFVYYFTLDIVLWIIDYVFQANERTDGYRFRNYAKNH